MHLQSVNVYTDIAVFREWVSLDMALLYQSRCMLQARPSTTTQQPCSSMAATQLNAGCADGSAYMRAS